MTTVPTVTIQHRQSGKIKKIDRFDYSRDIARWSDWKLLGEKHGDAPDDEVLAHGIQSNIAKQWAENPKEQAKRGDQQRAYEGRKGKTTTRRARKGSSKDGNDRGVGNTSDGSGGEKDPTPGNIQPSTPTREE